MCCSALPILTKSSSPSFFHRSQRGQWAAILCSCSYRARGVSKVAISPTVEAYLSGSGGCSGTLPISVPGPSGPSRNSNSAWHCSFSQTRTSASRSCKSSPSSDSQKGHLYLIIFCPNIRLRDRSYTHEAEHKPDTRHAICRPLLSHSKLDLDGPKTISPSQG